MKSKFCKVNNLSYNNHFKNKNEAKNANFIIKNKDNKVLNFESYLENKTKNKYDVNFEPELE